LFFEFVYLLTEFVCFLTKNALATKQVNVIGAEQVHVLHVFHVAERFLHFL
jgi:hypothetical protein